MSNELDNILAHYGVRGMKWGVRKRRNESERASRFGKKRSSGKSAREMSDQELREIINRMNMEQQYSRLASGRNQSSNRAMGAGAAFVAGIALNVLRTQIQNQANARIGAAIAAPRAPIGTTIGKAVTSIGRTEVRR